MPIVLHRDPFYDQDGQEYSIEIHQEGGSGPALGVPARNVRLRYQGDDSNIHAPILASSLELTISVTELAIETRLQNLYGAPEGEWRIVLRKGSAIEWVGLIVTDQVSFADKPFPYDFSINAVDGIARLRKIDYTGSGSEWTGWQTILQHLGNILSLIPTADLWGASDPYIKTHSTIFANAYHLESYTDDPFAGHRVNHQALKSVDSQGNTKYISAYELLCQLAKCWGARVYLADGAYHIEQVNSYARTDSNITIFPYDKTLTALTQESLSDWGDRRLDVDRSELRLNGTVDATLQSGGINNFLAPLKEVKLQYKHYSTRNLLPSSTRWIPLSQPEVETDVVDNDPARIFIQALYNYEINFTSGTPFPLIRGWWKFRCKLRVGSGNWCKRTANLVSGRVTYEEATWESSESFVEFFAPSLDLIDESVRSNGFFFRTPPVPSSDTLFVDFDFIGLYVADGTVLPDSGATAHSLDWEVYSPYVEIYFDGTADSRYQYTLFTAENAVTGNSEILETEMLFGTGPQSSTFGRIQANGSSGYIDAQVWSNYPNSDDLDHGQLIANQLLIPRIAPAKILDGTLRGKVGAHQIIDRNGERFVFTGGVVDLADASTDGTWVYITDVDDDVSDPGDPTDGLEPFVTLATPGLLAPFEPSGPEVQPLVGIPFSGADQLADDIATPTTISYDHATDTTDGAVSSGVEITSLAISETGVEIPWQEGDELALINPYSGVSQLVYVDGDEQTDTIGLTAVTPTSDFPQDSLVVPTNNFLWQLLNKTRRIPAHFELFAQNFEVAFTVGRFETFWRVPPEYNGYKLAHVEGQVHTAGSGSNSFTLAAYVGADTYSVTLTSTQERNRTTLSPYRDLVTGELIEFGLTSAGGTGTLPRGLSVTLIIIATI